MGLSLPEKIAAFCREFSDESLLELARQDDMVQVLARVRGYLQDGGDTDPGLEADLDKIDERWRAADTEGEGLYPAAVRAIPGWPGGGIGTGAQWWTCPVQRCAGRGRVRPGQQPPVCAATGQRLEPRPLPE